MSYAVSVSYALIVFLLTFLIYPDMSAWGYIIIISSIVILVTPINFRISRMIWMNLFSSYNKENRKNPLIFKPNPIFEKEPPYIP